jgi:hypothetical protein
MTSSYDPMPAVERDALKRLYAPFNEELFKLLGRRFDW